MKTTTDNLAASKLKIGILGGSGALASAVFLLDLTRAWARRALPRTDGGYPEILYFSSPFDVFTEKGIVNEPSVKIQLAEKINFFAKNGVDLLFVPCVSLMGVAEGLKLGKMKLISLVDETNKHLSKREFRQKKILVLSSDYTRKKKLFKAPNSDLVYLDNCEQKAVDALILSAIAGKQKTGLAAYEKILDRHKPDFILLGCTELPLVIPAGDKHIDPLKISLDACFAGNNY